MESTEIHDVYVLVEDWFHALRIIQVPEDLEEDDFTQWVEKETGLAVRGMAYLVTLDGLKRERCEVPAVPRSYQVCTENFGCSGERTHSLTDDRTKTAPNNINHNWDYDAAFRDAEGMRREEITSRARQVFSHTNHTRATRTGPANYGIRAAAIEQALAWANICRYMDITGTDRFQMDQYRQWVKRSTPSLLRRYLRLLNPRSHDWATQLGHGTEPVTFYQIKEDQSGPNPRTAARDDHD